MVEFPCVLILVFVEDGLGVFLKLEEEYKGVLILVFVEDGLGEYPMKLSNALKGLCLNPCFCGRWFGSYRHHSS